MRITWRLIVSLVLTVTGAAFLFALHRVDQEQTRLFSELDRRAWLRVEEFGESLVAAGHTQPEAELRELLDRTHKRERLEGLALYDAEGRMVTASSSLAVDPNVATQFVQEALRSGGEANGDHVSADRRLRIHAQILYQGSERAGAVAVFQDARYVSEHVEEVWRGSFLRMLVYAALIVLVTLFVVHWSLLRPLQGLARWIRDLRTGEATGPPGQPPAALLEPLAVEIGHLAKSYFAAQVAAREEARLRHGAALIWTADRLREHCRAQLAGRKLVVVANREPYMHVKEHGAIRCFVPASGLVTALEPVLRACGGTWVAHGSGNADREVVDEQSRVRVPPEDPTYTLRRVWLSAEEEQGYYYGFSNEGLWPLCHVAHTRPSFRPDDWEMYRTVNQRFCEAVLEEIADVVEPCVLIQDYHFALLAKLVKERRPDARVAIFWHIPWPNPESIGICPWQRDILQGLLAADLIGFHTQFHCNNFLETVDRVLESRIDWERFAVVRQNHVTHVKPFPISVAFTGGASAGALSAEDARAAVARAIGFGPELVGIGVDRIDYTKGIPERFRAVERFLAKHARYVGRFTFVQIGAPSRTNIPRYRAIVEEVEAEAERINKRFAKGAWRPIVLLARHHSHAEIEPFYRAADVCVVSALHDGMNLVAKEFVAARSDELGVLVLSQFAGASRELRDALIVNPYDVEQLGEAIRYALEVDEEEQRARMRRLRAVVRERNVYRWAADLIGELSQIRLDRAKPRASKSS